MELKYGSSIINLDLGYFNNIVSLQRDHSKVYPDLNKRMDSCFESLKILAEKKKIKSVSIILEDKTRYNPEYPELLSRIRFIFNKTSVDKMYIVPAYGTHQIHSISENEKLYGKQNLDNFEIINHNSRDDAKLTEVGTFSSGHSFKTNSTVAQSDFKIVIGTVSPHAFAGFTGGRKAILPGISDYNSIRENHKNVKSDFAVLGLLENNPVHENMIEAANMVNIDFTIQFVRDADKNLAGIFFGELNESFNSAVEFCREINSLQVSKLADIVLISAGGHPKDDSIYQSQRAIAVAANIVKPGGTVVLFGEFANGVGNSLFEEWLAYPRSRVQSLPKKDIDIGIHSIYLLVRNSINTDLYLYTSMSDSLCRKIQIPAFSNLQTLSDFLTRNNSKDSLIYMIPDGSNILIDKINSTVL